MIDAHPAGDQRARACRMHYILDRNAIAVSAVAVETDEAPLVFDSRSRRVAIIAWSARAMSCSGRSLASAWASGAARQ